MKQKRNDKKIKRSIGNEHTRRKSTGKKFKPQKDPTKKSHVFVDNHRHRHHHQSHTFHNDRVVLCCSLKGSKSVQTAANFTTCSLSHVVAQFSVCSSLIVQNVTWYFCVTHCIINKDFSARVAEDVLLRGWSWVCWRKIQPFILCPWLSRPVLFARWCTTIPDVFAAWGALSEHDRVSTLAGSFMNLFSMVLASKHNKSWFVLYGSRFIRQKVRS